MRNAIEQLKGKRVAVVMSAGYFGFFGHAGFAQALLSAGISPVAWAGSSAGALVAAAMASQMNPSDLISIFSKLKKSDFWDPQWVSIVNGILKNNSAPTGILRGKKFAHLCDTLLPIKKFEQLKTQLLITATNLSDGTTLHITQGDIPSAVVASCAYPGLFQAVQRENQLLWDGGIVDKAPVLATYNQFKPEALVLHLLPSRDSTKLATGATAFLKGINSGIAIVRNAHLQLQLDVLKEKKVPVFVVTSHLTPVSPNALSSGPQAAQEAQRNTHHLLISPTQDICFNAIQ